MSEIIKYYWLPEEDARKWWEYFGFDNLKQRDRPKRNNKASVVDSFVRENIGSTFSVKEICALLNITGPTFYNFFNSNRQYFRKVQHGKYIILDPDEERRKQDSVEQ